MVPKLHFIKVQKHVIIQAHDFPVLDRLHANQNEMVTIVIIIYCYERPTFRFVTFRFVSEFDVLTIRLNVIAATSKTHHINIINHSKTFIKLILLITLT